MLLNALGQGLGRIVGSPQFQGATDIAGRLGNAMQGVSGQEPTYQPPQTGFGGIQRSLQQINGAPIKSASNARRVAGGGRIAGIGPGTPAQGSPLSPDPARLNLTAQPIAMRPAMSPGGYSNGSGVPS